MIVVMSQLKELRIDKTGISDLGVEAVANNLPNLTLLNICKLFSNAENNKVTDKGIKAVADGLKSLVFLNFSILPIDPGSNDWITKVGVIHVACSLSKLEILNISARN